MKIWRALYPLRNTIIMIIGCMVLSPGISGCKETTVSEEFPRGRVIKVIDGDSLVVRLNNTTREIRLWGIDSPEYRQRYGVQSGKQLRKLVSGKTVTVKQKDVDSYNRIVALVYLGTTLINEEMIQLGNSWVYTRYCDDVLCDKWQKLQQQARKERLGLWKNGDVMPPWKWRQLQR